MSHLYLMNYTMEVFEAHRDEKLWGYLHFTAAHEETGQHGGTIDADLVEFLKKLTSYENTVIFVEGDHGMRYGNWYT